MKQRDEPTYRETNTTPGNRRLRKRTRLIILLPSLTVLCADDCPSEHTEPRTYITDVPSCRIHIVSAPKIRKTDSPPPHHIGQDWRIHFCPACPKCANVLGPLPRFTIPTSCSSCPLRFVCALLSGLVHSHLAAHFPTQHRVSQTATSLLHVLRRLLFLFSRCQTSFVLLFIDMALALAPS